MKILVVGAGPSGLMMAGELARHGLDCRIVDGNDAPAKESRAFGIQARTLEIFQTLGIADQVLDHGIPIHSGHIVIDGRQIAELDFEKIPGKYNYILSCPQSATEQVLTRRLDNYGLSVERGVPVARINHSDDWVEVAFANGDRAKYDHVIGADGARSIVRRSLDLKFEGDEVAQRFALADLVLEWDRPADMYLFANERGFLAIFPLPGGRTRIIATTSPLRPDKEAVKEPENANADPMESGEGPIELADIQQMFDDRSPYPGRLSDPNWVSRFVIHERIVDRMRAGRTFVVGDAAHLHSPAGGQGMNTGLQDAHNLAWKLALVATKRAHDGLLDSYDAERRPVDKQVVAITSAMMKNVMSPGPIRAWIRNHIAPHVVAIPAVHRRMMETVSEQSIAYGNSPIVRFGSGEWAGLTSLPGGALHVMAGLDADRHAAPYPGLCEVRVSDEPLRIIRPDGYVGAKGEESPQAYFDGLGAG